MKKRNTNNKLLRLFCSHIYLTLLLPDCNLVGGSGALLDSVHYHRSRGENTLRTDLSAVHATLEVTVDLCVVFMFL